jgi:hypothetical protein
LVDGALQAVHSVERQIEEAVEHGMHMVWTKVCRHGRGIGEIAEEHGDLLAFALEDAAGG